MALTPALNADIELVRFSYGFSGNPLKQDAFIIFVAVGHSQ
jgi:hypothetical protein